MNGRATTRGVFKAFIMGIRSEFCPIWFVTAKIVFYLFLDVKNDGELLNILTNILKREESSPEQVKCDFTKYFPWDNEIDHQNKDVCVT